MRFNRWVLEEPRITKIPDKISKMVFVVLFIVAVFKMIE